MKFLKPPKHALDIKSHKAVVKKVNAILNAKVVDKSGNSVGTVHFADGNTVIVIPTTPVGMIFRGEYNPATAYAVGDCVVIRSGASAGFYVCIAANAGQSPQMPDTGNGYWINLNGNAPTMGQWL